MEARQRDTSAASDARGHSTQVIGNKWDMYLDFLQADYSEGCVAPPPAAAALVCSRRTLCAALLAFTPHV